MASSGWRSAEDQLQMAERRRAVMDCTAELPEVYQSALRLHYWLGAPKVMAAVRPRRLSSSGRFVMGAYAVGALVLMVWTMKDAGLGLIAVSTVVAAAVAVGLSSYAKALAYRSHTVTRSLHL
jgi:hypothetical protein